MPRKNPKLILLSICLSWPILPCRSCHSQQSLREHFLVSINLPSFLGVEPANPSSGYNLIFPFSFRESSSFYSELLFFFQFQAGLAQQPKAAEDENGDNGDDETPESNDPHFEPIIPLPALVTVTTGEEDEDVVFSHRAKLYRLDKSLKEWKEKGVGDLKILKNKELNTYRVLLRRYN